MSASLDCVVSYRNSTSNHNKRQRSRRRKPLYLIEILHQTTTCNIPLCLFLGCILSKFYIKPQHMKEYPAFIIVVSYRNSTSNHNKLCYEYFFVPLYLIEILHQTTTARATARSPRKLYLIEILHQTTTSGSVKARTNGCILSKFYIKPQPMDDKECLRNRCILSKFYIKPQPMDDKKALRNRCILSKFYIKPQPHARPGGRRLSCILSKFYIKPQPIVHPCWPIGVVSYRNSTSNHNYAPRNCSFLRLYLIEILHQTTTESDALSKRFSCILSKFYIKPQLGPHIDW